MCSFDGAEHIDTKLGTMNIISFNTQIYCKALQDMGITTAASQNILTFMQLMAEEKIDIMLPYLNEHYTEKLEALKKTDTIFGIGVTGYAYEVHDMKMNHILFGKEPWNCNDGGYLYCSCSRKEGVIHNCNHECKLVTDEEHLQYDTTAARKKWKELLEKYPDSPEEELKMIFHKWCQTKNNGFNGFGVEAKLLPLSRSRPDVFHQGCGITRTLLKYLRFRLAKCSVSVRESFNTELASFLTTSQNIMWRSEDLLSRFRGKELAKFTENAKELTEWAEKEKLCGKTDVSWTSFCVALKLWPDLYKFLVKAKVGPNYLEEVKVFEKNAKIFYEAGKKSFLSRGTNIGGKETSYMHILRYVTGPLAKLTFERHGVGIGVFTLQGYKRRNLESKYIFVRHTNKLDNFLIQILRKLTGNFDGSKLE